MAHDLIAGTDAPSAQLSRSLTEESRVQIMWRRGHRNEIFVPWVQTVPNVACRATGMGSVITPRKGLAAVHVTGFLMTKLRFSTGIALAVAGVSWTVDVWAADN